LKKTSVLVLLIAFAAFTGQIAFSLPQNNGHSFAIFDNMEYKEKPDTAAHGLIASNVLYERQIWPNRQGLGTLPDQKVFQNLVKTNSKNPGPFVIDIESFGLRGTPDSARHNAELLETLADWAHQAAPGKVIGYYGTNTLADLMPGNAPIAAELAKHVDAFFTPLYTFDDDRQRWEKRAESARAEARQLDANKPIYFYIWPQYHVGSARALRYVPGDYWKFQLETARRFGNGVVIWGSNTYVWNERSGWWAATTQFADGLRAEAGSPAKK
jgi:hypothetical protein